MKKIIIAICTYKRNDRLIELLNSIKNMENIEDISVEVLIVDNYADSNLLEYLNKISDLVITYVIEPKKGIAYARNRCLDEINKRKYDYFIFLDDDETVDKAWLKEMIIYQEDNNADIVCGPVITIYPNNIKTKVAKYKMFDRKIWNDGTILETCGCGNVMIKYGILNNGYKFDNQFNESGGEDTDLFKNLSNNGYKIHYCSKAKVYEELVESRSDIKYLLKRSYISGISYIRIKHKYEIINKYMELIICLIKIVIYTIGILTFNILSMKRTMYYMSKISSNLGKISGMYNLGDAKLY